MHAHTHMYLHPFICASTHIQKSCTNTRTVQYIYTLKKKRNKGKEEGKKDKKLETEDSGETTAIIFVGGLV